MATALTAAVSLPSSKSSSSPTRTSITFSERTSFNKSFGYSKNVVSVSSGGVVSIRAQVTTEAPAKVAKISKKQDEGVVVNKYRPKEPYVGRCLLNTKITGDDAPGETWHMVFSTEGEIPYREGQSIGIIPDGVDKNNKPHKLRLYSIASSALGDFGDSKTVSLCVKRLVYTNDQGETVKGVCSNFLCDLKPGNEVKITGPVGKEMLLPKDPNATIIMLGTGTGIAPFRSFLWKMFFEKHEDYKSFLSGTMLPHCNSINKYRRLNPKLEKKLVESIKKRASSGKNSFSSINSIIMRFPQFNEGLGNIKGVFKQYDEDSNGTIGRIELKKCLEKLQLHLTEKEIEYLFQSCDVDGDEGIQFNEFIVLLCLMYLLMEPSPHTTSKMGSELEATFNTIVEVFLFFDKNGDGKLNRKEIVKAMNERYQHNNG